LPGTVHEPDDDILEGRILSGFERDENLLSIIDQLGSKRFMYASDYPHSDMDWGRVQAIKDPKRAPAMKRRRSAAKMPDAL
jgi:predicted TIM-barrel fold metal-dependent hydrolase